MSQTAALPSACLVLQARWVCFDGQRRLSGVGNGAPGAHLAQPRPDTLLPALWSREARSTGRLDRVSRDRADGCVQHEGVHVGIAAADLTATKARLLLMACTLRFGSLPAARNPSDPTPSEIAASEKAIAALQQVFDTCWSPLPAPPLDGDGVSPRPAASKAGILPPSDAHHDDQAIDRRAGGRFIHERPMEP